MIDLTDPSGFNSDGTLQTGPAMTDLVKESSTKDFEKDVLAPSRDTPVLVDFWAPWCGPCRQLGPALEKIVAEAGGKVHLVKINVDENQALASQMGIQSIPAVFAFFGGQPVDGFMGALPESELRKFLAKLLEKSGGGSKNQAEEQIEAALAEAARRTEAHDRESASEIYRMVLSVAPLNERAIFGLAEILVRNNELQEAETLLANTPDDKKSLPEYVSVTAAITLQRQSADLGSQSELLQRLDANPDDHQARLDLALARNAAGERLEAAQTLIDLMKRDREFGEDAARLKLIELFEAWGPKDPATIKGRRLLSAVLFS